MKRGNFGMNVLKCLVFAVVMATVFGCVTSGGYFQKGIDPEGDKSQFVKLIETKQKSGCLISLTQIDDETVKNVMGGTVVGDIFVIPGTHTIRYDLMVFAQLAWWEGRVSKTFDFEIGKTYTAVSEYDMKSRTFSLDFVEVAVQ